MFIEEKLVPFNNLVKYKSLLATGVSLKVSCISHSHWLASPDLSCQDWLGTERIVHSAAFCLPLVRLGSLFKGLLFPGPPFVSPSAQLTSSETPKLNAALLCLEEEVKAPAPIVS